MENKTKRVRGVPEHSSGAHPCMPQLLKERVSAAEET